VCKISSKLKKEISSLKRKLKKAEEVIEKIRINRKIIFESNRSYAANVEKLQRIFKEQYIKLRDNIQRLKKNTDSNRITIPVKVKLQFSTPNNSI